MFDLEEQLEQWKKRFTSMEATRSSDIEELEQHVRDSIAALTSLGLNSEEAFVIATYRVGAPDPVGREFAKVNGSHLWSQRVFWMAAGALGHVVCGLVIGAIASLSQVIVLLAGAKGAAVGYTAVGISCVGWAVLAALLYRRRNEPSRRRFTRPSAAAIGSFVACAVAVASLMKFGSQVLLPRLMPMAELGQALMISNAVTTTMSTALMPLALLIVMLLVRRHIHKARAVAQ